MTNFELAKELYSVADTDMAEICVIYKRMVDNDDPVDEIKREDYDLTAEDVRNFDVIKASEWFKDWMYEVISSTEVEASAWWKQKTPKEEFLALDPKLQQERLMETAMRAEELLTELEANGKIFIDHDLYNMHEVWEDVRDLCREFEYTYCETVEYQDFWGLTDEFFTKKLTEMYPLKMEGKIEITVFADTVIPNYERDDNLLEIIVNKYDAFRYFREEILETFKNEEKISDEAFFEDWLAGYDAGATENFFQWVISNKVKYVVKGVTI